MRRFKNASLIPGVLIAFLVGLGSITCLITAYGMHLLPTEAGYWDPMEWSQVSLFWICFWCMASAFAGAVLSRFKWWVFPGLLILGTLWLLLRGKMIDGAYALFVRIGNGILHTNGLQRWFSHPVEQMDLTPVLCLAACGFTGFTAITVCRRIHPLPVFILTAVPLICCLFLKGQAPGAAAVAVLLTGWGLLMLSREISRKNPMQILRLWVTVPVAVAMIFLLVLTPQSNFRVPKAADYLFSLVDRTVQQIGELFYGSSYEALDETVDLAGTGIRINTSSEIMTVTADSSGRLYLRGKAYDTYTGIGWEEVYPSNRVVLPHSDMLEPQGLVVITTRTVHAEKYQPYYCEEMGLRDNANRTNLTTYQYNYYNHVGNIYGTTTTASRDYVELPYDTWLWARTMLVNNDLYMDQPLSVGARAEAIGAFVKNSAVYSTWTNRMPGDRTDFAKWFLQESDTGYCVHFASAATVLLRAAGIPARYVVGYVVETKAGEPVAVRGTDAHAWVEYWVDDYNSWVILDPTPRASEESGGQTDVPSADTGKKTGEISGGLWWLSLLILPTAPLQWYFRLLWKKRRREGKNANEKAAALWKESVQLARLLKKPPDGELKMLAEKARFSRQGLSEEELKAFWRYRRTALDALKKAPWYRRIYSRLILAVW